MKAIVQDRFGDADVLELRDVEEPVPGEGEVRVQVRAAGAGPDVWHLMTGRPYFVRLMPGFHKWRSNARGRDVSGVVESVGPNVTGLATGDAVMGVAEGSFAELAVAKADLLVPKPARLSFEEAAAVPIAGLTALHAVRDVAEVQAGQRVLVIGAGGGVGSFTVQVAKAFGAHVTGVCSTANLEMVQSLGAARVIDYTRQDLTAGGDTYDVVFDAVDKLPPSLARRLVKTTGVCLNVGKDSGSGGASPDDLAFMKELIESGEIRAVIDRCYRLEEIVAAHRYVEEGHKRGHVVVAVT
jgi:NADPH:quinone reductase-like Zn-dependent oxidoreductase